MRRLLSSILVIGLGLLAACSGGGDDESPTTAARYVALGDSFVSGPSIATQDTEVPWCVRSDHNYPSLVAQTMPEVGFTDVSCGGEDTTMMKSGRTLEDGTVVGPQIDAVGADTTLVTIGIGGNDGAASAGLFRYCLLPDTANDADCATFTSAYMPSVLPKTRANVDGVIADVKKRAPRARIILVGYLSIAPESGQCPELPISAANLPLVADYEDRMNSTLEEAADRAEVEFVDVRSISRDHDACAGEQAWVNGIEGSATDGAFLHPTSAGMRAVADQVLEVLRR